VTDMAVIGFPGGRATLMETAPGLSVADVSISNCLRLYARACAPARDACRAAHLIRDDKKPSPGAGQNGDGLLAHAYSVQKDGPMMLGVD